MNRDVDAYLEQSKKWPTTIAALRAVLLSTGLSEAIKWRKPCYSHGGKNIVIIQEMNDFLALMFYKGALLSDQRRFSKSRGRTHARHVAFNSRRLKRSTV